MRVVVICKYKRGTYKNASIKIMDDDPMPRDGGERLIFSLSHYQSLEHVGSSKMNGTASDDDLSEEYNERGEGDDDDAGESISEAAYWSAVAMGLKSRKKGKKKRHSGKHDDDIDDRKGECHHQEDVPTTMQSIPTISETLHGHISNVCSNIAGFIVEQLWHRRRRTIIMSKTPTEMLLHWWQKNHSAEFRTLCTACTLSSFFLALTLLAIYAAKGGAATKNGYEYAHNDNNGMKRNNQISATVRKNNNYDHHHHHYSLKKGFATEAVKTYRLINNNGHHYTVSGDDGIEKMEHHEAHTISLAALFQDSVSDAMHYLGVVDVASRGSASSAASGNSEKNIRVAVMGGKLDFFVNDTLDLLLTTTEEDMEEAEHVMYEMTYCGSMLLEHPDHLAGMAENKIVAGPDVIATMRYNQQGGTAAIPSFTQMRAADENMLQVIQNMKRKARGRLFRLKADDDDSFSNYQSMHNLRSLTLLDTYMDNPKHEEMRQQLHQDDYLSQQSFAFMVHSHLRLIQYRLLLPFYQYHPLATAMLQQQKQQQYDIVVLNEPLQHLCWHYLEGSVDESLLKQSKHAREYHCRLMVTRVLKDAAESVMIAAAENVDFPRHGLIAARLLISFDEDASVIGDDGFEWLFLQDKKKMDHPEAVEVDCLLLLDVQQHHIENTRQKTTACIELVKTMTMHEEGEMWLFFAVAKVFHYHAQRH